MNTIYKDLTPLQYNTFMSLQPTTMAVNNTIMAVLQSWRSAIASIIRVGSRPHYAAWLV